MKLQHIAAVLVVAILVAVVVGWAALRRAVPAGDGLASTSAVMDHPAPPPRSDIADTAPRSAPVVVQPAEVATEGAPARLDVAALTVLKADREMLGLRLGAEPDATYRDVEATLSARGVTDPAGVATGWVMAQNWGIVARGEAAAAGREETAESRQAMAELRRKALIGPVEEELRALLGATADDRLVAELEQIGRKHAAEPRSPHYPKTSGSAAERRARRSSTSSAAGDDGQEP